MYDKQLIESLNKDIKDHFPHLKQIEESYSKYFEGVSRLVMIDRYSQKDKELLSLKKGDLIVTVLKENSVFPARGIGRVTHINKENETVKIVVEEEFIGQIDTAILVDGTNNIIERPLILVEKPLEIFYEQIAYRVAHALAINEDSKNKNEIAEDFFHELSDLNVIPAGRVLHGAGSGSNVTFFNCFVMPMIKDSRTGISNHRSEVMEIMSRGGGVGTNGSTLRPKGELAKTVGGKSSGAVSWLNDIASLTHLVEQGGSRRGAQMIMMADWHPDIVEFIISKMQNPKILQWLKNNAKDELIREEARRKLKFIPLTYHEQIMYEHLLRDQTLPADVISEISTKLNDGGIWEVNNPNFLTGANISIAITNDFMNAVEKDLDWELKFPDITNYTKSQKEAYDEKWSSIGDVRVWEQMGYKIKTHHKLKAKDLWDLINFCANYSAEPGIFFMDVANEMTNAKSYGMSVVATNPCGEQPLAAYSVCNLAAVNLANFVNKKTGEILFDKLKHTITTTVRMQDNVIDVTPYFLEANKNQAINERRVGLGVMGLHDLLIWSGYRYGSKKANEITDKIFEVIATTAYQASVDLAKIKGSFPYLESKEAFINTGYMKKMPQKIREAVLRDGIRNSHLLTIAPTGSTGTMVGVSTGLEPYFGFKFYRSGRLGKNIEINARIVTEYLTQHSEYTDKNLPDIFVSAMELTPEEHVDVQTTIQRWVDSSISKTVNAPRGFAVKDVEKIYMRLFKNGAKGGTVYVDGSRDSQVLSLSNDDSKQDQSSFVQLEIDEVAKASLEQANSQLTDSETEIAKLRGSKIDRKIGTNIGDLCPICTEGTVIDMGGCNTCNNCNVQLKCGL
ncbi:vitamin B12-dependent ribonucleotide reductase [Spiroplasma endosymbiont of Labia minor]|uniref:vitamin B12-dependent ribonucleotide reductase n=1 Tax=Spiroplasma endosymbiont of Labia minor TaxID=3066305 RepID=UPI0030D53947